MPSGGFSPTPNAPVLATGSDSGLAGDNITKVTAPTIEGIAAPGALVSVYLDGALVDSDTFADGQWSFTLSPLAEGSHDVTVTAELSEMAPSDPSPPLTFVIDVTPPTAQPTVSLDPTGDSGVVGDRITTDVTPTLRGQATPLAMVEILVDGIVVGSTSASATGGWTFTPLDTLELGSRVVTAQEVDAAGNAGPASRDLSLTIAAPAPAAPGLAVASDGGAIGDGITNDNTPTITGVAAAFADIRLLVGGRLLGTGTADADGNWSITPTQALADGRQELRVQTEAGGIVSDVSDALTLFIDTEAPGGGRNLDVLVTADGGSGVREWFLSSGGPFYPVVNVSPLGGGGVDGGVTPVVLGTTDRVLFVGDDGASGAELWVTNGTGAGTTALTTLPDGAAIQNLTATTDGRAVFTTVDSVHGSHVWGTDGSAFGTHALTEGGLFAATPTQFTASGDGRVFFVAETAAHGRELWVTDGTAAGTTQFLDAAPGPASGQVGDLAALADGTLLFAADDGTGNVTLRKVVGDTTITITGWDVFGGALLSVSDIVPIFSDVAVVIADVAGVGEELFLVSGDTVVGGLDLTPGAAGSAIRDFTILGPVVRFPGGTFTLPEAFIFTFEEAGFGRELGYFLFDGGTPSGGRLADIAPGPDSANITGLTSIGDGRAVFSAEDVAGNAELWITDGTSAGTYLFQEIRGGTLGSAPRDFTMVYPGTFLFTAAGDGGDREVWLYNGSEYYAVQLPDLNATGYSGAPAGPAEIATLADGRVVFNASTGETGTELWVTDGARDGLHRLTDAFAGAAGSDPAGLVVLPNQKVLFTLDDPASGRELWVTDGTEAGTTLLKDINLGGGANPGHLTLLDASSGLALFSADDGVSGRELWVTDGTADGTRLLKDIKPGADGSDVQGIVSLTAGKALFTADDGVSGRELWITDGTAGGTYLLKDLDGLGSSSPRDITALGNGTALFASLSGQLWITDGTAPGTTALGDVHVASTADPFTAIGGGRAIFLGLTAAEGVEAWITDGTAIGTRMLKDIQDGSDGSAAGDFTLLSDGQVLFRADDDIRGAELWITDLTSANTRLLADIEPGIDSSTPSGMVETIDGRVVFAATTVDYGRELWVFDIGTGDTYQLLDLNAGAASSDPGTLTRMADGSVVFWADDGLRGRELWITDGTFAGTRLFSDTNTGGASSNPLHFTPVFTIASLEAPELDETSDTGVLDNDRLTSDTTPLVWGYGEAGSSATVLVNDIAVGTAIADSFGVWELDLPVLAEGTHRVTFRLTDVAGNVSATSPATEITIDTTPPEATFAALPVISTAATLRLDGTVSDSSAVVRLLLEDPSGTQSIVYAAVQDEGGGVGSWSYSIPAAPRGDWTVTVTAVDDAGNEDQTPSTQSITLRPSAPPVLAGLAAALNLSTPRIEAGPVRLDPDVSVSDPDGVFFTGSIVVSGQLAEDVIGLASTAAISLSGTDVIHGGIVVGSVSGGTGGADFLVALNGTRDVAVVEAVVEAIAFASSAELGEERRTLTITLDDGLGGTTAGSLVVNLAGRRLSGGTGAETLEGTARSDQLGGAGGDDVLLGRGGADSLAGGAGNDVLRGEDGNDTLDGGPGADTLEGGSGNDLYVVDDGGDEVTELASGGIDRVNASVNHVLAAHVDNLLLTGTAGLAGTGNALANVLTGNTGANVLDGDAGNDSLVGAAGGDTLVGGDGNDWLDGGLDADSMVGGAGNDSYVVDAIGDVVVEAADGGIDRINTAFSYGLLAHVENLRLTGAGDVNGTGNALANGLSGNAGANVLDGDTGNDTLIGDAGADTLVGGDGNDWLDGGLGADSMVGGAGNDGYVVDAIGDVVEEAADGGIDRVTASIDYLLGGHVENLRLTGTADLDGTGNPLANALTGNAGANILDGDAGNDTLIGAAGADTLVGADGNDWLDGGLGVDSMVGGAGNDGYVVDAIGDVVEEAADGGIDRVTASIDFLLGAHVEQLRLTGAGDLDGTGNALANALSGNAGANVLDGDAGNDTLIGAAGADTLVGADGNDWLDGGLDADSMVGGAGNDSYVVDAIGDVVVEAADGGVDRINAAFSYGLLAHVENLQLTGTADLDGAGNALANGLTGNAGANILDGDAGNDTLIGAAGGDTLVGADGNDWLDGGLDADSMVGGAGNDSYVVDAIGDVVEEAADGGIDRVTASIDYMLGAHVEQLRLTGAGDLHGTGNALANALTGNAGANVLDGGVGNDTLSGGLGADTLVGGTGLDRFFFNALDSSQAASPDIILDFSRGQDRVQVDAIDPSAAPGNQAFLWIGSAGFTGTGVAQARTWQDGTDTYAGFDDGSGGEAEMVIRFNGLLALTATDFIL